MQTLSYVLVGCVAILVIFALHNRHALRGWWDARSILKHGWDKSDMSERIDEAIKNLSNPDRLLEECTNGNTWALYRLLCCMQAIGGKKPWLSEKPIAEALRAVSRQQHPTMPSAFMMTLEQIQETYPAMVIPSDCVANFCLSLHTRGLDPKQKWHLELIADRLTNLQDEDRKKLMEILGPPPVHA